MTNSAFEEKHLQEILRFIKQISPVSEIVCGWEVGRFVDWHWSNNSLKLSENPEWFADNCQVFCGGERVKALAISEDGGQDVCVLTEERDPRIFSDILDWLVEHWAPKRGGLSFEISHNEYWLSSQLEEAGFSENTNTGHEWEYDLALAPSRSHLPEGFSLETLAEGGDEALFGIAKVAKKAFSSKNAIETIVAVLKSVANNPLYLPELSVYARSAEGKISAYCRGTVNPQNGIASIDPVCCHPDFFRRGLAKAVVQECFRRQAGFGGCLCYIGSAPMPNPSTFLYRSLKPRRFTTGSCWNLKV